MEFEPRDGHDFDIYFDAALDDYRLFYPQLTFGEGWAKTVRYFPDKLPIGVTPDHRHVFLYLVTGRVASDFRAFLVPHADLLQVVRDWNVPGACAAALLERRGLSIALPFGTRT